MLIRSSAMLRWCLLLMVATVTVGVACEVWLFNFSSGFQRLKASSLAQQPFDYGPTRYPILYAGGKIRTAEPVQSVTFFAPLFGGARPQVNPTLPLVGNPPNNLLSSFHGSTLLFEQPGEYYLKINGTDFLKVLVLDRRQPIDEGVVKIFDFTVANTLWCNGGDPRWSQQGTVGFISEWFTSQSPALLLCGPTGELFRQIVFDRFALPSRIVTFPGTYRQDDGSIGRTTHNVPEVYLPGAGQFVMFDINNAFFVRWMGAMELAQQIHTITDDRAQLEDDWWQRAGLDVYQDAPIAYLPESHYPNPDRATDFVFEAALVSGRRADSGWDNYGRLMYGGIAYFGRPGYGTAFLGRYTYGVQHEDPALAQNAMDWIAEFNLPTRTVSPDQLRVLLEAGFAEQIAQADWRR